MSRGWFPGGKLFSLRVASGVGGEHNPNGFSGQTTRRVTRSPGDSARLNSVELQTKQKVTTHSPSYSAIPMLLMSTGAVARGSGQDRPGFEGSEPGGMAAGCCAGHHWTKDSLASQPFWGGSIGVLFHRRQRPAASAPGGWGGPLNTPRGSAPPCAPTPPPTPAPPRRLPPLRPHAATATPRA